MSEVKEKTHIDLSSKEKLHIDPSIKYGIKIAKDVLIHIVSYWYLLLMFIILAFIIAKLLKKEPEVKFIAPLTFTINQVKTSNTKNSNSDVARLVTDFGFGGGNATANVNSNRLIELSKSNVVLTEVLFRKYEINGDLNYLANHFRNIHYPNVTNPNYFEDFVSLDSLSRGQNAVLNGVIGQIKKNCIFFTISPSGIFKLRTKSKNEEFSKMLSEGFYEALSELYIEGATAKAKASFDFTEKRKKESENKLYSAESTLASYLDSHQSRVKRKAYLQEIKYEREVSIANSSYSAALSSYERAKINLENQRPIFQMIDPPRYPLPREVTSSGSIQMFAIVGAIAFFLFITITLYLYKNYGYLLNELFEE